MSEKRDIKFAPDTKWGAVLAEWHGALKENRGDRAALRKCKSLPQVVFVPAYHELYQDIAAIGRAATEAKAITWTWETLEERILERLPMIAALSASLIPPENPDGLKKAERDSVSLPRQMGTTRSSGGGPWVSDLRFRRLLKCHTPEDLYPSLRRVIGLLRNHADIMSLANSVFYWDEEMRKRWAYDYYATASHDTE